MRRIVVIAPEVLSEPGQDSYLSRSLPGFKRMSDDGSVGKVAQVPRLETPESLLLGMKPGQVELRQGPLTVSSLGFDPPERSTHFHVSLLSAVDGKAALPTVLPRSGEIEQIVAQTARLDSKRLTTLVGERFDHGLVWEEFGDMGTTPPQDLTEGDYLGGLPEGDGETLLRRYIDDSVNLLSELEVNVRRVDEGLPPFNLLWPWGHGVRTSITNLALKRGEPGWVESNSMRLAGLTRLAGYRHVSRKLVGEGLRIQFGAMRKRALEHSVSIIYLSLFSELRRAEQHEEMDWALSEFDREFLVPILQEVSQAHDRFTLAMPGPLSPLTGNGIPPSLIGAFARFEPGLMDAKSYPLDERILEEKAPQTLDLPSIVVDGVLLSS